MATTNFSPGSVEHALSLAAKGFAVFPLAGKHPLTPNGFKDAVTTPNEIRNLWKQFGRAATGVGIATGPASGVWVLDVDVSSKDDKHGDESLAELESKFGELPETYTVLTGSGENGKHLYFRHEPGIKNSAGRAGQDLDVRADGGYVVAEGSIHPDTEGPYLQDVGLPDFITEAPKWLVDLVTASSAAEGDVKPVKPSAAWDELLKDWTLVATLRNGDRLYRRPGKTSGEHSAVLHAPTPSYPDGYLYNFSPNSPGMEADTLYGVKIDPYEDVRHLLDKWEALFAEDEEEHESDSWTPKSIRDALNNPPALPDLMYRSDDIYMLYKGKLNYFYGAPECGKSWAAHLAVKQTVESGGHVVYLDFENDVADFAEHMTELGVDEKYWDDSIAFFAPDRKIILNDDDPAYDKPSEVRRRVPLLKLLDKEPSLIILDGVSNAMGCFGFNPLDNAEVVLFEKNLLRRLIDMSNRKAALVCIDHAPKNTAEGAKPSVFGAQHKLAQVTGVTYHFAIVKGEEFGREKKGRARITIMKDKPGHLRKSAPNDSHFGDLVIDSTGPKMKIEIAKPDDGDGKRRTFLMERVSRFMERIDAPTTRQVIANSVDGQYAYKMEAVDTLIREGYVGDDMLPRGSLNLKKKFRENGDVEDLVFPPIEPKSAPPDKRDIPTPDQVKERAAELDANPDFARAVDNMAEGMMASRSEPGLGGNQPWKTHPDFPHQLRRPIGLDHTKRQKMEPLGDDKITEALQRINATLKLQGKPLMQREDYFAELAKVNDDIDEENAALDLLDDPVTKEADYESPLHLSARLRRLGEDHVDPGARADEPPGVGRTPGVVPATRRSASEGRVGDPEGRVGDPEDRVGDPEDRVGDPEDRVGDPEEAPEASERSGEAGGADEGRDSLFLPKGGEIAKTNFDTPSWATDL